MVAKGGLTKGKSHKEGGIPMVVKDTGQNIEVEGGEIIINKYSSADTKKHDFDGQKLTKCEIASKINSADGKGVKIDCDDIVGKKYKYADGGRIPLSRSLGIERQNLPQVRHKDYPAFFTMLEKDGITFNDKQIDPQTYDPSQKSVLEENIKQIYEAGEVKDKPVIVSNDGFVLDGHHRWYYAVQENIPLINAIVINLPIYSLIEKVNLFKLAEREYAKGGEISINEYPSFFIDSDGDGIPNVDDISPFDPDTTGQIEEVSIAEELKNIINYRNSAEEVRRKVINDLTQLSKVCGKTECGVLSRTKTPFSIINKMRRRSLTNTKDLEKLEAKAKQKLKDNDLTGLDLYKGLTDVVGTMVVAEDYDTLDKLTKQIDQGKIGKVLEYENFYDIEGGLNGYRAIHYIVGVEHDGLMIPVEIQVKTKRSKKLAEGSHTAYKRGLLDSKRNDELSNLVWEADKGNKEAQEKIDPIINDTQTLKEQLTMMTQDEQENLYLQRDFKKGGNVKYNVPANSKIMYDQGGVPKHSHSEYENRLDELDNQMREYSKDVDGLGRELDDLRNDIEDNSSAIEDIQSYSEYACGGKVHPSRKDIMKKYKKK